MTLVRIDFVSDVSCPWCAVGLKALEAALDRVQPQVGAELHFQPFELNPGLPAGGVDFAQHMARVHGSLEGIARGQEALTARGAALGLRFDFQRRTRIYNTFDAHRLLHWAGLEGRQHALKSALFRAYFTDGEDIGDPQVLARVAEGAGLDGQRARRILTGGEFAPEVRAQQRRFAALGINAVPSVIFNGRHLLQGGQPPEVFEQALRQIGGATTAPD